MSRHPRLWVVIADGEHARIAVQQPHTGALLTTTTLDSPTAGELSRDLGTDRPGRSFESAGTSRHAIAPKHDPHEMEKQKFLKSIAQKIDDAAAKKLFDSLLLVAPGKALATLRGELSPMTKAMLVGTLAKDLTKIPDHDLREHVSDWV